MKRILFVISVLFLVIPLIGQDMYFNLSQANGVSSFTRNLLPFGVKYSTQTEVLVGFRLSESIGLQAGLAYQSAGASNEVTYESPNAETVRETYSIGFLKIPVELSMRFGEKLSAGLDIGCYYNLNINQSIGTNASNGEVSGAISVNDLSKNDFGIRVKPVLDIHLSEKYMATVGVLQEFGLIECLEKTHHFNTYITFGLKVLLNDS